MALICEHIEFAYHHDRPVLREISLSADPGQVISFLGPNGSGKTTLLRLCAGLIAPNTGKVLIDNKTAHTLSAHDRALRIGFVPQQPSLAFAYELASYVGFGRHALGRRDAQRLADQALDRLDLAELRDRPVGELSAGQRQRAAIARAYCQLLGDRPANCTRLLLADEPLSALDPRHALLVTDLLGELANDGVLVVTVLHDLALASRVSDRLVLLSAQGTLLAQGPPGEVLEESLLSTAYGIEFRRIEEENRLLALLPVRRR